MGSVVFSSILLTVLVALKNGKGWSEIAQVAREGLPLLIGLTVLVGVVSSVLVTALISLAGTRLGGKPLVFPNERIATDRDADKSGTTDQSVAAEATVKESVEGNKRNHNERRVVRET